MLTETKTENSRHLLISLVGLYQATAEKAEERGVDCDDMLDLLYLYEKWGKFILNHYLN
jgi:hypothetical protein